MVVIFGSWKVYSLRCIVPFQVLFSRASLKFGLMKIGLTVVSMSDNSCLSEGGDYSACNLAVSWPMAEIKGTRQAGINSSGTSRQLINSEAAKCQDLRLSNMVVFVPKYSGMKAIDHSPK